MVSSASWRLFFFFSSRRRHTRCSRDWSSDVCSSDLDRSACEVYCYSTADTPDSYTRQISARTDVWRPAAGWSPTQMAEAIAGDEIDIQVDLSGHSGVPQLAAMEIGRASCRERV